MSQRLIEIAKALQTPLKLNAAAGAKVMVITDTQMDPLLWQGLATAASGLDMEPVVTMMLPRSCHAEDPVPAVCAAALDPSIDLVVYLTSTAMAHAPITEALVRAQKRFILMEELTVAMLAPGGPAWADYGAINRLGLRLAEVYTAGRSIKVTCPNGTHLTASIEGRVGRSVAGIPLSMRPGGGGGLRLSRWRGARLPGRGHRRGHGRLRPDGAFGGRLEGADRADRRKGAT